MIFSSQDSVLVGPHILSGTSTDDLLIPLCTLQDVHEIRDLKGKFFGDRFADSDLVYRPLSVTLKENLSLQD